MSTRASTTVSHVTTRMFLSSIVKTDQMSRHAVQFTEMVRYVEESTAWRAAVGPPTEAEQAELDRQEMMARRLMQRACTCLSWRDLCVMLRSLTGL